MPAEGLDSGSFGADPPKAAQKERARESVRRRRATFKINIYVNLHIRVLEKASVLGVQADLLWERGWGGAQTQTVACTFTEVEGPSKG